MADGFKTYRGISKSEIFADTPIKKEDARVIKYLKKHTLPGFEGRKIYDVGKYFLRSMFRENLNLRASSLSFNFFLSLFPILIFLLTLIAQLPVRGLRTRLIVEIALFFPKSTSDALQKTIQQLLSHPNSGLLSFGFILALYFASNAYHTMINTFNRRLPQKTRRTWIQNRLRAIFLTLLVSVLAIVTLYVLTQLNRFDGYILGKHIQLKNVISFLLHFIEYSIIIFFVFVAISSMYYFGPGNKKPWKFFSAGSILAGTLSVISTFGFTVYVNNFNSYNKVYGSIGAIIALMVLIYINTLVVIVGFELNASIDKAHLFAENEIKISKQQTNR
jgi:membrane protein